MLTLASDCRIFINEGQPGEIMIKYSASQRTSGAPSLAIISHPSHVDLAPGAARSIKHTHTCKAAAGCQQARQVPSRRRRTYQSILSPLQPYVSRSPNLSHSPTLLLLATPIAPTRPKHHAQSEAGQALQKEKGSLHAHAIWNTHLPPIQPSSPRQVNPNLIKNPTTAPLPPPADIQAPTQEHDLDHDGDGDHDRPANAPDPPQPRKS